MEVKVALYQRSKPQSPHTTCCKINKTWGAASAHLAHHAHAHLISRHRQSAECQATRQANTEVLAGRNPSVSSAAWRQPHRETRCSYSELAQLCSEPLLYESYQLTPLKERSTQPTRHLRGSAASTADGGDLHHTQVFDAYVELLANLL